MLNQRWRTQILRVVAIETREATPECNAISIDHISCRIYAEKARKSVSLQKSSRSTRTSLLEAFYIKSYLADYHFFRYG